jgi:hypothetical protein
MRRQVLVLGAMVLMLTLLPDGLLTASFLAIPIDEFAEQSDLVVIGHVEDIKEYRTVDGTPSYSIATLRVSDVLKGSLQKPQVQVEFVSHSYLWQARPLKTGEHLLLFLLEGQSSVFEGTVYHINSLAMGVYEIYEDGIVKKSWYTKEDGKMKRHSGFHVDEMIKRIRGAK